MRWESVHVNARARETPDGRKTSGRTGGIWGPGVRWGHTCNAVKGGRCIYVFGGYGSDKCQTNDVHVFDTVKQTWCKPMMKGILPSPRDSHSCTTVGSKLFVFGGTDGTTPLRDLHILDTSSNTWITPTLQGEGPDAREGHSAALAGRRLFIFGGCGKSSNNQEIYYNDLYILDTDKLVWERALASGTPPSARDSHTSSSWKNKIIVLGGEDSSDCYLSDVHMLDADTLVWKQVSTSGQMLAPRAGHTTIAFGNNLYVFGGFTDDKSLYDDLHILHVDTGLWSRVATVNRGPCARFSVAGDCLDEWKGILVFIGGCNKDLEALDDMFYLHTDMCVDKNLFEERQKYSLKRELKKKCQENYLPIRRSEKDIDASKVGVMSDPPKPVYIKECNQSGTKISDSKSTKEVTFEARVTNANQYGYTIQTVIDGKLLHGMLFSCTSNPGQNNHSYPNKKRKRTDAAGNKLNKYEPILRTVTANHHEAQCSDKGQTDGAHGKESPYQESPIDLAANLTNSALRADANQLNTASRNMGPPSAPSGDLKHDETPDDPDKPITEKPCKYLSAAPKETQPSSSTRGLGVEEHGCPSNGYPRESR